MKRKVIAPLLVSILVLGYLPAYSWGFYAHRKINYYATFLLPPEMIGFYKANISFVSEHAVDPDKRRYAVKDEGIKHFIDMDNYGIYPFTDLPRKWEDAINKYGEDIIKENGIVPWHIQTMLYRLTNAFKEKNLKKILKNSAEIGHYIADAHVPLHTSSNHDGQKTNQKGIHGFWESRVPELIAEKEFDYFIGKASYLSNPSDFIWNRILESANAVDSVLTFEKKLTKQFSTDKKYAFETKDNKTSRQYSSAFTIAYNKELNGMIERRMRQAIYAVASFWYTAWVNAGQPNLNALLKENQSETEIEEFEELNKQWQQNSKMLGREED